MTPSSLASIAVDSDAEIVNAPRPEACDWGPCVWQFAPGFHELIVERRRIRGEPRRIEVELEAGHSYELEVHEGRRVPWCIELTDESDGGAPYEDSECAANGGRARPEFMLPRGRVLSAYSIGPTFGYVEPPAALSERLQVGSGVALGGALSLSWFDEIPVRIGFGMSILNDLQPFSEQVVSCTRIEGSEICDGPREHESKFSTGWADVSVGYQWRFRLPLSLTLAPAAYVGYLGTGALSRGIGCEGCKPPEVFAETESSRFYAAPALKLVVVNTYAIGARYRGFFSSGFSQALEFNLEFMAP